MNLDKNPNLDEILPATRITKVMADEIEQYCEDSGLTASQLVRKALNSYLQRSRAQKAAKVKRRGGQ